MEREYRIGERDGRWIVEYRLKDAWTGWTVLWHERGIYHQTRMSCWAAIHEDRRRQDEMDEIEQKRREIEAANPQIGSWLAEVMATARVGGSSRS